MSSIPLVILRMQALVLQWEKTSNHQAVFLSSYLMMTRNMFTAIEQREFLDPVWVDQLLINFAQHYFAALDTYGQETATCPLAWQLAHNSTRDPKATALQNLMLGVNAHINYDLVLTLVDLLGTEWHDLSETQRVARYTDYSRVNDVIARTIDIVQDQILAPTMPSMVLIDRLLGPFDEMLVSSVVSHWRETVWQNTCRLLDARTEDEHRLLLNHIEADVLRLGRLIYQKNARLDGNELSNPIE